jgi:hypothetical protein
MAIFGVIKSDDRVFTGDKIRFDFSQSFTTPDVSFATSGAYLVSFDGTTFIDCSAKKYIDYIFTTAGAKTITLKLTDNTPVTPVIQTFTKVITSIDITLAKLFSKDNDLYQFEPDIDAYLPKKWSSWNMIHRQAQEWIIDWLDEQGIYKSDESLYTAADIIDSQQVKQLSIYKTLEIIFEGNSNVAGDIFSIKRDKYKALVVEKSNRAYLRLDYDGDGVQDSSERVNMVSGTLTRG